MVLVVQRQDAAHDGHRKRGTEERLELPPGAPSRGRFLKDAEAAAVQKHAPALPHARVDGSAGREVGVGDDAAAEPVPRIAGLSGVHRLPDEVGLVENGVALSGIEPHPGPAARGVAAPRVAAGAEPRLQKARIDAQLAAMDR